MKNIDQFEIAYLSQTKTLIDGEIARLQASGINLRDTLYTKSKYLWEELPPLVRTLDDAIALASQLSEVGHTEAQIDENNLRCSVLEKMREKPYFGRVDFSADGEESERFYFGISNLMDKRDYSMVVCDWRTPVASLFYENGIGRTTYQSPDGPVSGAVTRLRQYEIENGELQMVIDADVKIDDSILLNALGGESSEKMKTIISTIQREQNLVIRDSESDVLLVLGPAGSGKTSIALHRVAYLLYRDRKKLKSKNILVFSPNDIFSNYIAGVIPELGEQEVMTTTFAEMIQRYCGSTVTEMYEQIEFMATSGNSAQNRVRKLGIMLKGSREFPGLIKSFAAQYVPPFSDLCFHGQTVITAEAMGKLYTERFGHMNRLDRMDAVYREIEHMFDPMYRRYLKEKKAELLNGEFVVGDSNAELKLMRTLRDEAGSLLAQMRESTRPDFHKIYGEALAYAVEHAEMLTSEEKTLLLAHPFAISQGERIYFEDGIGILLLMTLFGAIPLVKAIKHVVIDEIQDYSPAQHEIFARVFANCGLTMLGDTSQLVNTGMGMEDGEAILSIYGRNSCGLRKLSKSYRSTLEINLLANAVLKRDDSTAYFERHGKPVSFQTVNSERAAAARICELLTAEGKMRGATAVITRTIADARKLYQKCHRSVPGLILADDDKMAYEHGRCIIPLALSKGMEFDRVILADSSVYTEGDEKLLYVAMTRAMHELTVIGVRKQSVLIPEEYIDRE